MALGRDARPAIADAVHQSLADRNQSRQPTLGLALADAALARKPDEPNAHSNAALALARLGRLDEAGRALRQAIALQPDQPLFHSNLAAVLREQGRLEESERILLDDALPRDPRLWTTHLNLGLLCVRADRPDLATRALEEALRWPPAQERPAVEEALAQTRRPEPWLRWSDRLMAEGQAQLALEVIAQAQALGAGEVDVVVGRGAALALLGRLDEAEAVARAAPAAHDKDARLYNLMGQIALARGDKPAARRWFEQAIPLSPDWPLPKDNLERAR